MRPNKYQYTRRVQFLIASFFVLAALLFPTINRAAVQVLTSITVTPAATTIGISQTKQFLATLHYQDGSQTQLADGAVSWASAGALATARYYHTATKLQDGSVLVVGGYNSASTLASAERFDPVTGLWTSAGSMANARAAHTATLLPNGKVLVAGGQNLTTNGFITRTELYDPLSNTWSLGPNLTFGARAFHTAVALNDGNVLITAGIRFATDCGYHATTEIYNWTSGLFSVSGSLILPRSNATAVLLDDGRVLLAGGPQNGCPTPNNGLNEAEVWDPVSGLWTTIASMSVPRFSNFIAKMPNGKVLLAGGRSVGGTTQSVDVFNPATNSFSLTAPLSIKRATSGGTGDNGATVVLSDGRVLVAGGNDVFAGTTFRTA